MEINKNNINNIKILNDSIIVNPKENSKEGYIIYIKIKNDKITYDLCRLIYGNGGTIEHICYYETLEEALKYCFNQEEKKEQIIYKELDISFSFNDIIDFIKRNDEIETDFDSLYNGLKKSSKIVTAWKQNKLIGVARLMGEDYFSCNIDFVFVDKSFRRQGIGTKLVNKLIHCCLYPKYINVSPDHKELIPFYEKLGFHKIESGYSMQLLSYEKERKEL